MIDTGLDLNLIKEYCVDSRTWTNKNRAYDLVGILQLNDLNEAEKLSLFETIGAYLYPFHLPGDKLASTNLVTHSIITTDNKPVFHKNYR